MKNIRVISDTHFNHQLLIDIGDRKPGFEIKIYENLLRIPKGDAPIIYTTIRRYNKNIDKGEPR